MERREIERLLARFEGMRKDRAPYESVWRELADYYLPRKAGQFSGGTSAGAGDERIFDSTPFFALDRMAGWLSGLLTNPNQIWIGVRARDPQRGRDAQVRSALAKIPEVMLRIFRDEQTGFQAAVDELYLDNPLFGTGVFYVEADPRTVARFTTRPLSETFVAENRHGMVDTVFRDFEFPAADVVAQWPETCSRQVRELAEREPRTGVGLLHLVMPREDRRPGGLGSADMPVASVYLEKETKTALEETGYHELPFMVPRWAKAVGETYGRGPGLAALSDVRVLNAMARTALLAGEKMADPPLMVPDDDFVGPVQSGPGGLSYYRAGTQDRIEALPVAVDLRAVELMLEQRRGSIRRIFLVDEFDAGQAPTKTAYQVMVEDGRKMTAMAPVLGRFQSEFLGPLIRRVFRLALRQGAIPPLPDGMDIGDVEVFYTSPLAQAQRQAAARGLAQALELLAPLIGQEDPFGILDNFDMDRTARVVFDVVGVPPEALRSEADVARLREDRDRQRAASEGLNEAERAVDMASKAARADTGSRNLLTDMLGGGA
jgi:hypothetical protein